MITIVQEGGLRASGLREHALLESMIKMVRSCVFWASKVCYYQPKNQQLMDNKSTTTTMITRHVFSSIKIDVQDCSGKHLHIRKGVGAKGIGACSPENK